MNHREPPQYGTDRLGISRNILGKGQVSWSLLDAATQAVNQTWGWEWNKTGNRSSVFGMLTLNIFLTILVLNDSGVEAKGGAVI